MMYTPKLLIIYSSGPEKGSVLKTQSNYGRLRKTSWTIIEDSVGDHR